MKPLLKKYKNHPHPLDYKNIYQLLVKVLLSAQSTDDIINKISPAFFEKLPNMQALSRASEETLYPLIAKVRNFRNKASWLMQIAKQVKKDSHIPLTLDELTELPGIGRKSANVILREAGKPAEGVIVDIHVVRVAPRLGIANGTDPKKIEQQLMVALPQQQWDAGMAMSFLGRDICRPKPLCPECLMRPVCAFYQANKHILQFTSSKNKR